MSWIRKICLDKENRTLGMKSIYLPQDEVLEMFRSKTSRVERNLEKLRQLHNIPIREKNQPSDKNPSWIKPMFVVVTGVLKMLGMRPEGSDILYK